MTGRRQAGVGDGRPVGVDIAHLDMDSFFAAVEVRADPTLAGRPVVVGGAGPRGVVASASYEARGFGVHAAMPMGEARRLCPGIVVVQGHYDEYVRVSVKLAELLAEVTPLVEPVALDEAYLDVSGALRSVGSVGMLARALRARVRAELGLFCSVGVGSSKLIAKLASKAAKPTLGTGGAFVGEGVLVVGLDEEEAFLRGHLVRAVPGVGPRSAEKLARYGVATVGDLALVGRESLVRLLGAAHGSSLYELAQGRDHRLVEPDRVVRSIGHEETFANDERSIEALVGIALEMSREVAARCRHRGVGPRCISVKVRFSDFTTITRSKTLPSATTTGFEIGQVASELLGAVDAKRGIRLLGVHASLLLPITGPGSRACQLELFGPDLGEDPGLSGPGSKDHLRRHAGVEIAADEIRLRYGKDAIGSLAAVARRSGNL